VQDALSANAPLAVALFVALAAALGALFAWLLRGARLPGGRASSAILGGMLAGVLLGPGVLGRVAPDVHGAAFRGAVREEAALADRLTEARGAVRALEASGVTEVAIDEYERGAMAELGPLREAADSARVARRGAWDVALALAGAALLALLPLAGAARMAGDMSFGARRAAIAAGAGSFAAAGAIAGGAVGAFTDVGWSLGALLFAGACATGWFTAPLDRLAHARARAVRESFVSGLLALAIASATLLWALPDRRAWFAAWGFIGALTVWAIMNAAPTGRRFRRVAHGVTLGLLAPTAVALAAMRLDPLPLAREPSFWVALVAAAVASSDGRWLGAFFGARVCDGAGRMLTTRSVEIATAHTTAGVGLAQCALLALLAAGGPITEPLLAGGLLGALLVESSAGLFRVAGAWLEREAMRA